MTTTSATEKQAAAIKQRMQEIRSQLPYDVDDARHRVKQLTDWKYHVRKNPLPVLAAAAVVGYLVVPVKQRRPVVVQQGSQTISTTSKRGFVSNLLGSATTLLLREAVSLATNQASTWIAGRSQPEQQEHKQSEYST